MSTAHAPLLVQLAPADHPAMRLSRGARDALERDARSRHPQEACGLLAGVPHVDRLQVVAAVPFPNLADHPTRSFRMDPLAVLSAPPAGATAWLGVYHSHPEGPAQPSHADLAAAWPHLPQLVLGRTSDGEPELHAYVVRTDPRRAVRLPVRSVTDSAPPQNRSV